MTTSSKTTNKAHVHVEGLTEICDLPGFRNTPKQLRAIKWALEDLTQVRNNSPVIVRGTLWVILDLGDVTDGTLELFAPCVIHRVGQKVTAALQSTHLTRVK